MTSVCWGLAQGRALRRVALTMGALLCALLTSAGSAAATPRFEAGAASVDITPPAYTTASDAAFVPACGTTPAQVAELWPGPRQFQFEKPYRDEKHLGRFAIGDAYCESDATGRYEAPYIAGGSGQNHWPESVDPGNGPAARAVVVSVGSSRAAIVSVDSIGMFNVTFERIRAEVEKQDPGLTQIFISSTHDESAPDPIDARNLVRHGLHGALHLRVVILATHQALDGEDGVFGVGDRLTARHLSDQALAALRDRHNGRSQARTLAILKHGRLARFNHRYDGVSCSQVNANYLSHSLVSPLCNIFC